jgi:hypothetical protein
MAKKTDPTEERPTTIMIDYDGHVGAPQGRRPIRHTSSPRVFPSYQHGRAELVLQPGLNLVERDQWVWFYQNSKSLKQLVAAGDVRELSTLPERESNLFDLIERTIDPKGLDALEAHARTHASEEMLLSSVSQQRRTRTHAAVKPAPYISPRSAAAATAPAI